MRHEKAVLVILAYVIGFNTAFILFGLNDWRYETRVVRAVSPDVASELQTSTTEAPESNYSQEPIAYVTEGDLYAEFAGKRKLLSVYDPAAPGDFPGLQVAVTSPVFSPQGDMIFFCETPEPEADYCHGYLYSFSENLVYLVKDGAGDQPRFDSTDPQVTFTTSGALRSGTLLSTPETPWVLDQSSNDNVD